jgi:hypothetical protein
VTPTLVWSTGKASFYPQGSPLWYLLPSSFQILSITPQVPLHLYLPEIGQGLMLQNYLLELQKVIHKVWVSFLICLQLPFVINLLHF